MIQSGTQVPRWRHEALTKRCTHKYRLLTLGNARMTPDVPHRNLLRTKSHAGGAAMLDSLFDMRRNIQHLEAEMNQATATGEVCARRACRLTARVQKLQEYAYTQLMAGDEAAARATLKTKLEVQEVLNKNRSRVRHNMALAALLEGLIEREQQELFARLQQAKQQLELPDMKQQPAAASSSMCSSGAASLGAEPAVEGSAAARVPREHLDSRAAAAQAASTSSSSTSSTSSTSTRSGPRQSNVSRGVGEAGASQDAAPPDAGQQGSAQQAKGAAGGSGQVDVLPAVCAMYRHAERAAWDDEAFEQAVNDALTQLRESVWR